MKLPFVSRKKYNKLMGDYEEVVYKFECLLYHAIGNRHSKHIYSLSVQDFIDDKRKEDEAK